MLYTLFKDILIFYHCLQQVCATVLISQKSWGRLSKKSLSASHRGQYITIYNHFLYDMKTSTVLEQAKWALALFSGLSTLCFVMHFHSPMQLTWRQSGLSSGLVDFQKLATDSSVYRGCSLGRVITRNVGPMFCC